MRTEEALLKVLSDGKYHSGAKLGEGLGVSRSAIWKAIQKLEQNTGLSVYAVKGKGYRLSKPLELLDKDKISGLLSRQAQHALHEIEIFLNIDSTNQYMNKKSAAGTPGGSLVLAESQNRGQGRRGRQWVSPLGGNICLSLLWRFQCGPVQLGGLSLVVAIAIVRAIRKLGVKDVGVKWPNDIYWQNKKLAGILLEMRGEADGPSAVVIGIGINVSIPLKEARQIDQPWVDLESILQVPLKRNRFTAILVSELIDVLMKVPEYQQELLSEWQQMDVLKGQQVEVHFPDRVISGYASGIAHDGALLLMHNGEEITCHSGEVSIRRV